MKQKSNLFAFLDMKNKITGPKYENDIPSQLFQ